METNKENTNSTLPKRKFEFQGENYFAEHPLNLLSLSDLISLHGWIDSEADLIEALGGDNTARLEEAREQMTTIHKEIERKRNNLFGGEGC